MPASDKPRKPRHRTPPNATRRPRQSRPRRIATAVLIAAVAFGLALLTIFSLSRQEQQQANKTPTTPAPTTTVLNSNDAVACPKPDGEPRRNSFPSSGPPECLVVGHSYTARVTTDAGAFVIALDPSKAPRSTNVFVFLARYHFYDGLSFHKAKPGFFVQTGDPAAAGVTGPGFVYDDQLPKQGEYLAGSVAMANPRAGANGSQFLIITEDAPALRPQYPLFGHIVEGLDIVRKIAADGSDNATPKVVHQLLRITIEETE